MRPFCSPNAPRPSGDVILTGTPQGSVDVQPGDEVVCEVQGLGRLHNTLVADWA